ncbi:energy-coupling factor transporter transmembrane component T [Fredinandcohnia sp. QZ13]|uniref:energy-coupling factor transporter transmembrane component T family protein n=1 Tax=Fredinandcohnia sp. QZ13 TaxID=3073144 RepID=UPI0028530AFA|nr:energy-coupling factor transporter transmembrane component T [Fredinandcohnia sp. QZ13]MDR4887458.1 energy-coupling factor transporter transmembrane component T [Fredinandcohnia sp. QZ13]
MELAKFFQDKLSLEYIKNELVRTAYSVEENMLTRLDPRVLLIWYCYFGIVPWFIYSHTILVGYFIFMVFLTYKAKVSPLILTVLILGLIGEVGLLFLLSLLFGGNIEAMLPMFWLSIKLASISLASVSVFSSLNPEKFSDALLRLGFPDKLSFSIAYGYRILPTLFEEFQQIILSYRLRGKSPSRSGLLYWRKIVYLLRIFIRSFYPLMLNTAKRSRTTVEALETKGFTYGTNNRKLIQLKTSYLKLTYLDYAFILITFFYLLIVHSLHFVL